MVISVDERRERHRMAVRRYRSRKTADARLERLLRDRERRSRMRSTASDGKSTQQPLRESKRAWLDGEIPRLDAIPSRTKENVLHQLRQALGPIGLDETTCAVCDCYKPHKSIHKITVVNSNWIQRMQILLSSGGENLPTDLIAEYDCSDIFEELSGILLSKRGVHRDGYVQSWPAALLLPTSVGGIDSYRVVLAGPFTTEQRARIRQMHVVRREVVEDLLVFYREHNTIYEDISIDCSQLMDESIPERLISVETDANVEAEHVDAESERIGSVAEIDSVEAETDVVERKVVFISEDREVSTQSVPVCVAELPTEHTSQPQFLVRHSTQFTANDKSMFARMFPHLFPYGRGHPREDRQVPVSLDACIRRYGLLSTRRFAEDELFMLVCFDVLSVQKMYRQVALKCKRDPALFEPYSAITEASLMETLQQNELHRQGRIRRGQDDSSSARSFLKTVELSGGAIWGSDAERAKCRCAFAYQARYGQPALFVTLTPNVGESFVMAHYTGITSIDTLFDANLADLPNRTATRSAGLHNDVASARLFMHNVDAFIEHVLNVPPKQMKSKVFDGLFGDVEAYFGMVEAQGGGTLHVHFLVWLVNAPPNTEAFYGAVAKYGDQYSRDIATYTDSIVSTSLPLDVNASSCLFCGHSLADLQELPIPPEAFESPNAGRCNAPAEPLLTQCSGCATKMSSQHVLRRILLQHRPSTWPPPMRAYTSEELGAAVQREVKCRGSVSAAKRAVFRRDMCLSTMDDMDDSYGDHLRSLNMTPNRDERREDDAFRNDKVARAIATLPPSVDDERWLPNAAAFAVSMLVFLLNLHWWSHVGSCFKSSRASMPGKCRYGFPRARFAQTSCTNTGVELARRTPFEYVNGFNATMMLAFKSNHDIQVLIGGPEAVLRIFYTTKYVTKAQSLVDSITAVVLAAFKRRRLRELQDESNQADRSTIGRRRVASLAFAITNRREIAGPLAVLYLFRGSCAYMSATCTLLPLKNILCELIEHDAHSCHLVELREQNSNVTFRAASFLDDYIFRPSLLDGLCLYEYVMKCFRRKQTRSTAASELFLCNHPLHGPFCVGYHKVEVVPVVTGVRMPYMDSETPRELVVKRSKCALVLFKPFRNVQDIVNDSASDEAWMDAYFRWESTRTSFVRQIMANMDDYYRATMQAKEEGECNNTEPDHEADDDELTGTRNDVEAAIDNISHDDVTSGAHTVDELFPIFHDDATSESTLPVFPTSKSGLETSSTMHQELMVASAHSTVDASNYLSHSEQVEDIPVDELQHWVKDSATDEAEPSSTMQFGNERPANVIELIQHALESDREWLPQTEHPNHPPLSPYSSISDVSRAFTLNQRQHVAFSIVATSLLHRFKQQELANIHVSAGYRTNNFESQLREDQLLMFLGGAGGTGKSRVIDAVDAFCSSWHHSNCIMKTALTGKAATLIGGRTLASFMIRLQHAIKEKRIAPLDILVIDEVSMMTKSDWLKLDKLLRRYMQIENIPFGGIHIVLVGDFLQMPPVQSDPIYLDPANKAKPSTTDVEGFELWRKITKIVILNETMRFRNDPDWGTGCQNARLGRWTPEFIDMINARVLETSEHDTTQSLQGEVGASAVFVTPENATRLAINNAFIAKTASMLPNNVYPIRVVANFKGALNNLSQSDLRYVLSLPDNRFGRMAPYLDLINGMPIQVTQNIATAKGIANGTLGTLEYVHFVAGTQFQLVRDGATGTIVQIPSQPPDYAMNRVQRPQATAIRPGVDPDLFPVFFATEAYSKTTINLTAAPNGHPRSITVRPQQFPFVCAIGSTVYKVQGETLQSIVIMDWKSKLTVINKPQQTYLLISRVTTRNGMIALKPLTAKLALWSKPPKHALQEEDRLNHLSDLMLAGFHLPVSTNVTDSAIVVNLEQ